MKRKLRLDARLWERGIIAFISNEQNAADWRNFPSKTVHHSLAGGKPSAGPKVTVSPPKLPLRKGAHSLPRSAIIAA